MGSGVSGGPLIPGLGEFDRPKRGLPRWAGFLIAFTIGVGLLLVIWGFAAGSGPFSNLGQVSRELQPSGYRPTVDEDVIQVKVTPPQSGICADQNLKVMALESLSKIEIAVTLTGPRSSSCQENTNSGSIWIDVLLQDSVGDRAILRSIDGDELLRTR
jgi:hypothetical protein